MASLSNELYARWARIVRAKWPGVDADEIAADAIAALWIAGRAEPVDEPYLYGIVRHMVRRHRLARRHVPAESASEPTVQPDYLAHVVMTDELAMVRESHPIAFGRAADDGISKRKRWMARVTIRRAYPHLT